MRVPHPIAVLLCAVPGTETGRGRAELPPPRGRRSVQAHIQRVHGQLGRRGLVGGFGQSVLRRAGAAARALGADQ